MYIRTSVRRMQELATLWGMFLLCYIGHFLHVKNSFVLMKLSQKMAKDGRNVQDIVLCVCVCVCDGYVVCNLVGN
jgi:hypothetical protein